MPRMNANERECNVSITVPHALPRQAEEVALQEGRTKSEPFREALRRYLVQTQFRELQRYGIEQSRKLGAKAGDVERLIGEYRQEQRQRGCDR